MALFGMVWRMETRWHRYVMLGLAVKESVSAPVGGRKWILLATYGHLFHVLSQEKAEGHNEMGTRAPSC
jgi:hypothetical protein